MKLLDLTLPTPAANLACDEALLDWREAGEGGEILRFWESRDYFVALGYANKVEAEVRVAACRAQNVPILRRASGGGTVLQGPGCLNYALILKMADAGLADITRTNGFVMERHRAVLAMLSGAPVEIQGVSDLAMQGRKFSGNAQHRRRRFLLFHGTFLLGFDLGRIEQLLQLPPRQPAYRQGRAHSAFLMNLDFPAQAVKAALREAWQASETLEAVPSELIEQWQREKFALDAWNWKF